MQKVLVTIQYIKLVMLLINKPHKLIITNTYSIFLIVFVI